MKAGKLTKKLLALTLSVAMVLSSGIAVFAADETAAAKGPKVQLNGEQVAFEDAVPQNVNSRVMVPFRAILETLGATVEYDKATTTVTATTSDTAIEFQIGKSDLTVTKDGKDEKKTMDVVPFVDAATNRTYVSTRFVAEAFGYTVGWDQKAQTVIIIDFDKLFANMDKDFRILSMEDGSGYDVTKAYKTTGTMDGSMTINVPEKTPEGTTPAGTTAKTTPITLKFDADMNAVTQVMATDMLMKMNLDLADLTKMMTADTKATAEEKAAAQKLLDSLKTINMEIKMDENLNIYMKSDVFALLGDVLGTTVDKDTWLKVDAAKLYKDMGIDLKGLIDASLKGDLDLAGMITQMMTSMSSSMTVDTYKTIEVVYSICKDVLGDDAWKTAGNTHTLTLDKASLMTAAAKHATELGLSAKDMSDMTTALKDMDLKLELAVTEKDGKVSNTKMDMTFDMGELGTMTMKMNGNSMNMTMEMGMKAAGIVDMSFKMDMKSVETSEKVDVSIPAGAKTVDLNSLMTAVPLVTTPAK